MNSVNQYTQRGVPHYIGVIGIAAVDATVTVEGSSSGVYRHGEYFRRELGYTSNPDARYQTIDVDTDVTSPVSGEKYLPEDPESFTYDDDGNLTSDDRWTYAWDGENRLTKMERNVSSPSGARQKLEFEYDWQGRRIRKEFFTYSSGWQEQSDTIYLYDGWNLLAELNANSANAEVRTYIWGLDMSGTEQGAGGVGGVLMAIDHTDNDKHHFYAHDGNGNVAALVDATDGTYSARYEYGPFGESIRGSGDMAYDNPFRFSTKYTDNESGLCYYGYRYYNPNTGRWLNRDPIGEEGGINIYCYANNSPHLFKDYLGLWSFDWKGDWSIKHQARLRLALIKSRDRAKELVSQIDDELAVATNKCYIAGLKFIKCVFKEMTSQINGKEQLEVRKKKLDSGIAATAWHARSWYAAELNINTHYKLANSPTVGFALDAPNIEDVYEDIFHESTHLAESKTDDGESGIPWRDSHKLEQLFKTDLKNWGVVKGIKKGLIDPCEIRP